MIEVRRVRAVTVLLLALSASLPIVGCGSDAPAEKPTVRIPPTFSEDTPERKLIEQIYAQALQTAGFEVKRGPTQVLPGPVLRLEALKAHQIDGYAENLSSALFYDFHDAIEKLPRTAPAAYRQTKSYFEKQGFTAFPPTPFGINNAVVMLRKTAEERGLKTDSDLKGKAEKMTIRALTYCTTSLECLGGLHRYYNVAFKSVGHEYDSALKLGWWRPEPSFFFEILENGKSDASMVFTTDGRLFAEKDKFVSLEDDKHVFPAGNVFWVTTPKIVDEAGPAYEKAIADAQSGLTLKAMRELNARMELEKKPPAKVAAEYLNSIHFTG